MAFIFITEIAGFFIFALIVFAILEAWGKSSADKYSRKWEERYGNGKKPN